MVSFSSSMSDIFSSPSYGIFRLGFCPQGGVERGRCTGHDHVQRRAIDEGGFFFVFSSLDLMLRATKVTGVSELVLHLLVVSVVVVLFLWE
jgi:hypothetical protein